MKQKLFTLLFAVAASVGTMFAWNYERVQIGDLFYNLDATNQTAEVTSSSVKYSGDIIIPSSVTYNSVSYSVTSIGFWAFYGCTSLTSVTIPNSVTSIGNSAFNGCTGLTSVTIPNSVISIENSAFYECSGLTSVTIGNSVTSIGESAFLFCTGLTSINVASDNPNYCSVNGVLFNKNRTTLISCPGGKQGAYSIPNSVTSIGNYAFNGCTGLTSVMIPNSVTSIGDRAFVYCTGLTSPVYNAHVFAYMPRSYSGAYTIPDGIESIAGSAFYGCTSLTSVTIPNSVTSIGKYVFEDCTGLTSPVYNAHVFAFMPTSYSGAYTIPDGIESIAGDAFRDCTSLTSVTIGNSVTSIGNQAFFYCTGLTSVTIGNSVNSIGNYAFYHCTGLTSVTNFANTPQEIKWNVFDYVDKSTCVLYVPAGSIDLYKAADQWKDFTNILPISQQGLEDVQGNNLQCTKVVRDGQIFILRGDKTYTIQGQEVK